MKKHLALAGCALLGAAGAYALLLSPRRGAPGWDAFQNIRFAHRGLHDVDAGVPENSLSAFRRAAGQGLGAELDVHLMADGNLAVVHDSQLLRVCGKEGVIEELTRAQLQQFTLRGSEEKIPLLREVLPIFTGKAPLIIELKVAGNNAGALTDAVMAVLMDWPGKYCIESFHPAVLLHLRKKYPWVLRGQLSENFLRDSEVSGLSWPARFAMSGLLTTRFTRPDFIAYRREDRNNISLRVMKTLYGVHEVSWTIRDPETLALLERQGVTGIFENFTP